jgi:hypothetical protein
MHFFKDKATKLLISYMFILLRPKVKTKLQYTFCSLNNFFFVMYLKDHHASEMISFSFLKNFVLFSSFFLNSSQNITDLPHWLTFFLLLLLCWQLEQLQWITNLYGSQNTILFTVCYLYDSSLHIQHYSLCC